MAEMAGLTNIEGKSWSTLYALRLLGDVFSIQRETLSKQFIYRIKVPGIL